jgi:hypothetical protein
MAESTVVRRAVDRVSSVLEKKGTAIGGVKRTTNPRVIERIINSQDPQQW